MEGCTNTPSESPSKPASTEGAKNETAEAVAGGGSQTGECSATQEKQAAEAIVEGIVNSFRSFRSRRGLLQLGSTAARLIDVSDSQDYKNTTDCFCFTTKRRLACRKSFRSRRLASQEEKKETAR